MDETAGPRIRKGEVGAAAVALASALARTIREAARAGSLHDPARNDEPQSWLAPDTAIALALLPVAATFALFLAFVFAYARKRPAGKEATARSDAIMARALAIHCWTVGRAASFLLTSRASRRASIAKSSGSRRA